MTDNQEWVSASEAVSMLKPILDTHSARKRICERAHVGLIRARAAQYHHAKEVFQNFEVPQEFWWAKGHEALEQDWAAGDFSTWLDRRIPLQAFGVTFSRPDLQNLLPPGTTSTHKTVGLTEDDQQTVDKLHTILPSAALSYNQAVLDLGDSTRLSFRGPALELREALRETLDHLAPDGEVTGAPGYIQEEYRNGPTMKQKVRFILKRKHSEPSIDAAEKAATAFEEAIANLTRAVYNLSSRAAHVASERRAVVQLRRYVVTILHEIMK
jgi:Predicted pPIWI-associating nuclease